MKRHGLVNGAAALLVSLLVTASHGFGQAAAAAPAAAAVPTLPVYDVAQPPFIDGVLNDACWRQAKVLKADFKHGKTDEVTAKPSLTAMFAWDAHYLYVGYTVYDRNLWAGLDDETQGPVGSKRQGARYQWSSAAKDVADGLLDVTEFFISFGSTKYFWELHHNASNGFNDVWCTVMDEKDPANLGPLTRWGIHLAAGEYLNDDEGDGVKWTFAKGTWLLPKADGQPSTVSLAGDEDTGYTGELRIPWGGLNPPLKWQVLKTVEVKGDKRNFLEGWSMAGQEMRVCAVVQNMDLDCRYTHSNAHWAGGWFHQSAPFWTRCQLVPAPK